jgi:hypothetical protein
VIERIDLDNRKVEVRLTKEQIKNSPEFDPDTEDFRSEPTGGGSGPTTPTTTARPSRREEDHEPGALAPCSWSKRANRPSA